MELAVMGSAKTLSVSDAVFGREFSHDLVHQVLAEFATEDRVGNRQRLGATDDCEFHDPSP